MIIYLNCIKIIISLDIFEKMMNIDTVLILDENTQFARHQFDILDDGFTTCTTKIPD